MINLYASLNHGAISLCSFVLNYQRPRTYVILVAFSSSLSRANVSPPFHDSSHQHVYAEQKHNLQASERM